MNNNTLNKNGEDSEGEYEIRRLAAIVEHSQDAIMGADLKGIITDWNKGAERVYGYSTKEITGRNIRILAPPDKIQELEDNIKRTLEGEEISELETIRRNKDGKDIFVSLTTSAIKDNEGSIVGLSVIARDVTEKKEKEKELIGKYEELTMIYEELSAAEEELRQNYEQLEILKEEADKANRAKSQFLANMSHEIRTPMNGVMCVAQLLSGTQLNEQQREYVSLLKTSSESLMEIINNLLDISKIESGRFKLNREPFNLRSNIVKIVKELRLVSKSKGIEIMYFIDPFTNRNLIGDSLKLNQVLYNLIDNAIKFTEKGYVFIKVKKVSGKDDSIKILFSVEDTGIGISDEVKDKLFKAFSQGDDSYTKKYRGTGLGLAISKEIVNMMGGEIWIDSEEGPGSTFYFTAEFSIDNSIKDYNTDIHIKAY